MSTSNVQTVASVKPTMEDRVLDAARRCVLRSGGRKIALAEVAREAGVSRPTVYRRWPEMQSVIGELLTREMARLINGVEISAADDRGLSEQVARIVAVASAIRDDELFVALWREQADAVAPYVFARLGTSQRSALQLLEDGIAAGQRRGQVRAGDPVALAAMVLMMTQSAIQSHALLAPFVGERWGDELAHALTGYLKPEGVR